MKRTFINSKQVPIIFGTKKIEELYGKWREMLKISDDTAISIIKFISLNPSSKLNLEVETPIELSEAVKNIPVNFTGYDSNTHFVKVEVFDDVVEIKFHKPSEIWVKEGDVLNKVEIHKHSRNGETYVTLYLIERHIQRRVCQNGKEGIFSYSNNYANMIVVENSSGSKIEMNIRTKKESSNAEEEIFKILNCEELEDAVLSASFNVFDILKEIKTHGFNPKEFYRFNICVEKTSQLCEKIITSYKKAYVFEVYEYDSRFTINLETQKCYYVKGDISYMYDGVSKKEKIECKEGCIVDVETIRSYMKELLYKISMIED